MRKGGEQEYSPKRRMTRHIRMFTTYNYEVQSYPDTCGGNEETRFHNKTAREGESAKGKNLDRRVYEASTIKNSAQNARLSFFLPSLTITKSKKKSLKLPFLNAHVSIEPFSVWPCMQYST